MAVTKNANVNIPDWNDEKFTHLLSERMRNAFFISHGGRFADIIDSTASLMPTPMYICPLVARSATGVNFEALAHNAFDVDLRNVTASLVDPDSTIPQAVLDRLTYLATLSENWDGEGSAPVASETIEKAKVILTSAFRRFGKRLPLPFISPAHDGMIVAEWDLPDGKELILDIPPDDEPAGFLLSEPHESGEIEVDAELGSVWSIEDVIQRLLSV